MFNKVFVWCLIPSSHDFRHIWTQVYGGLVTSTWWNGGVTVSYRLGSLLEGQKIKEKKGQTTLN